MKGWLVLKDTFIRVEHILSIEHDLRAGKSFVTVYMRSDSELELADVTPADVEAAIRAEAAE
jgi:hypothetical protein